MHNGEQTLRLTAAPFINILSDPTVTDIVVNRIGEIGVERRGQWEWIEDGQVTFDRLDAIAILAGFLMGKDIDESNPVLDTYIPVPMVDENGNETAVVKCRLAICRPSACESGNIVLSLRRPPNSARSTQDDDYKSLFRETNAAVTRKKRSHEHLRALFRERRYDEFLIAAAKASVTMGSVGATGTGKTDMLRRYIAEIPAHERIVTAEDTPEFGRLPQRNHCALYWGAGAVPADAITRVFMRFRPDRPVMQEVRGPEAYEFLKTALNGHPGGMTSWHSEEQDPYDSLMLKVKSHPEARGMDDEKLKAQLRQYVPIVFRCEKHCGEYAVAQVWYSEIQEDVHHAA